MNVNKGIRKNRSVTSVKGLTLRVGPRGLFTNVATTRGDCSGGCGTSGQYFDGAEDKYFGDLYLEQ